MNKTLDIPVLLIIFNRPHHTRRVINAIRNAQPRTLLVVADGPRYQADNDKCKETREIISSIDWDCDIRINYSDVNLGCGVRVYTAVDWAFSQFEDLIILEDDCIPNESFFRFCQDLLRYYRNDERVMHIGGFNFQPIQPATNYSYYFSKYTIASGGWATWRRAWQHYDWKLIRWPEYKCSGLIECWCDDLYERKYWTDIFDEMYQGAPDVWDYQWNFTCWSENGLAILPSVHLLQNIGFGDDATHTKQEIPILMQPTKEYQSLHHPTFMFRNYEADAIVFENNFGGTAMRIADSWKTKISTRLRPLSLPLRMAGKVWRVLS